MTAAAQLDLLSQPPRTPALTTERALDQVHPPLARLPDPPTSHEAAADYKEEAEAQNRAIYYALCGMGPQGGDCYAIAERLRGDDPASSWDHVRVSRRLAGLRERGMIRRLVATSEGGEERPHKACHLHVADIYKARYREADFMAEPERRKRAA